MKGASKSDVRSALRGAVVSLVRRRRLAFAVQVGAWPGLITALAALGWLAFQSWKLHQDLDFWPALVSVAAFLMAGIVAWIAFRPHPVRLLLAIDDRLGTRDLLGAAWAFDAAAHEGPWFDETVRRAGPFLPDLQAAWPGRRSAMHALWPFALSLIAVLALTVWAPGRPQPVTPVTQDAGEMASTQPDGSPEEPPTTALSKPVALVRQAATRAAQKVKHSVAALPAAAAVQRTGSELATTLEKYAEGKTDAASVMAAAEAFSKAVDEAVDTNILPKALEAVAPELAKALESDPLTEAIAKSLQKKDIEGAANLLKSLIQGMSEQELSRLADKFKDFEGPDLGLDLPGKDGGSKGTGAKDKQGGESSASSAATSPMKTPEPPSAGVSTPPKPDAPAAGIDQLRKTIESLGAATQSLNVAEQARRTENAERKAQQGGPTEVAVDQKAATPADQARDPALSAQHPGEGISIEERQAARQDSESGKRPRLPGDSVGAKRPSDEGLPLGKGQEEGRDPGGSGTAGGTLPQGEAVRVQATFEDAELVVSEGDGPVDIREAVAEGAQQGPALPSFRAAVRTYRTVTEDDVTRSGLPRSLRGMVDEYFDLLEGRKQRPREE